MAIIAFCMPFVYAILDAVGTFADAFYLDDFKKTPLIGVTEETLEAVANTSYELTFAIVALILFIFMKIKTLYRSVILCLITFYILMIKYWKAVFIRNYIIRI